MADISSEFRGQKLGWGPWRRDWMSICSRHHQYQDGCQCCRSGYYSSATKRAISGFFHRHFYSIWYWYANRPNSMSRQRLDRLFPGLRDDGKGDDGN